MFIMLFNINNAAPFAFYKPEIFWISFSVVDDEFIPDPVKFYNQPNSFDQAFPDFSEFSRRSKQGTLYKSNCFVNPLVI